MRGMVLLMGVGGFALAFFGGGLGALAYHGTKHGAEAGRALEALPQAGLAVAAGLVLMALSQALRVLLAIEENTRLTAYYTRIRARVAETQRPGPPSVREQAQV